MSGVLKTDILFYSLTKDFKLSNLFLSKDFLHVRFTKSGNIFVMKIVINEFQYSSDVKTSFFDLLWYLIIVRRVLAQSN